MKPVLLLISVWCALSLASDSGGPPATPNYIETGDCEDGQVCSYSYSGNEEHFNDGGEQATQVNATVDITCTSSGLYNDSDAKLYCMSVKNANIMSNLLENSSHAEKRAITKSLNDQLGNWFCFIQTYTGKIPAVYHSPSEPDHAISLKKSIAAAFQANFEGTDEEEETDPLSQHTSHYTYTPTTEEGLLKMKRTVRKDDVEEYSNDANKDDIDTSKDEEIQYRSGKLERSAGRTSFHLVNDSSSDNSDLEPFSLSQTFAARGSYLMELQSCRTLKVRAFGAQKKKIMSEMQHNSKEEGLKSTVNKEREGQEEMRALREKLPSGSALKALRSYNGHGDELVQVLQSLMELETSYGALESYIPVIDEIITFVAEMPSSKEVREAIIMLLSTEGSLKSQMVLLNAYDSALDSIEANMILTHISFMETVRIGFIIGLEERLARPADDVILANQLLLAFASLATKGSDEVESRIVNYLKGKVSSLNHQVGAKLSTVILVLHALGNTGSKLSISPILRFLESPVYNNNTLKIKLAVIEALGKVTDDSLVLTTLEQLLDEDTSLECIATIIETLDFGVDYAKESSSKQDFQHYIDNITSHPLVYSLAEAVSSSNDTDLHNMMDQYLRKIKADEMTFALIYNENGPLGNRAKRGTSDWDSTSNTYYNDVASLVDRQFHVNHFDQHRAYIDSRRIGIDKAHARISYGYFAGTSSQCGAMKAFGRTKVVGKLLSYEKTIADVRLDVEIDASPYAIAFAKIGSNTLLDYSTYGNTATHCKLMSRSLAEFRQRLFSWRIPFFIYVGTITLRLDVYAHFNMGINVNFCLGRSTREISGALASLTPTIGITVSGRVTATLAYLIRGTAEVSVTINYRIEPAVSAQACPAFCALSGRVCLGIYDSQHGSNIRLRAYYQTQTVRLCGSGWFRYPCLRWGSQHTWDRLTKTWSIGRQARRAIVERCSGNLHSSCASGALSSQLFTAQ